MWSFAPTNPYAFIAWYMVKASAVTFPRINPPKTKIKYSPEGPKQGHL
jgi:hypothetical protein